MKTLVCWELAEDVAAAYNLGSPTTVLGYSCWAISDALYTLILLTLSFSDFTVDSPTKDSLYIWMDGTVGFWYKGMHLEILRKIKHENPDHI